MRGSLPFSSSISALDETPISVPIVSNISTNKNANITTIKSTSLIEWKSALNTAPNVSLKGVKSKLTIEDGIVEYIPAAGSGTYIPHASQIIPRTHVAIIPIRIPPLTFLIRSIAVIKTPTSASMAPTPTEWNVSPLNVWYVTSVESLLTISFAS